MLTEMGKLATAALADMYGTKYQVRLNLLFYGPIHGFIMRESRFVCLSVEVENKQRFLETVFISKTVELRSLLN